MSSIKYIISPKQCKVARSFLGWSQDDLAANIRVTKKTVADFERGFRVPYRRTVEDICEAFKAEGILFEENDKEFVVRLLKK